MKPKSRTSQIAGVAFRYRLNLVVMGVPICGTAACSCDYGDSVTLVGRFVEAETMKGISDLAFGGRAYSDGELTATSLSLFSSSSIPPPAPLEDGTFLLTFQSGFSCDSVLRTPDIVEVIVVRDECEQMISIDINEQTIMDLDARRDVFGVGILDRVLELREPILVFPCQE